MVCVRFAPSPTGYLHIGGVRTALFNYLYAKNQGGQFFLRIEDTDRERSKPEFEDEILEAMKWLGLEWDADLWRQSERLEVYRVSAEELIKKDLAYREAKDGREAVRFRTPHKRVVFDDLVHGRTEFDTSLFDDLVILKSDGYPTYHWACAVDDHAMGITHVIRGDDHLPNTPRQILLYEAMGWKPPKFAHLPLILGEDGTPLSKRHGAVALSYFKERGYLSEALLNYLALLGWGSGDNQEFFTLETLIKKFSLKRVNKAGAQFNGDKLDWLNGQHLKSLPEEKYLTLFSAYKAAIGGKFTAQSWRQLLILYRTRLKVLPDIKTQAWYCFEEIEVYPAEPLAKFSGQPDLKEKLETWLKVAADFSNFSDFAALEEMTRQSAAQSGIEAKVLIHPLRFAVTAETVSPGLFELMSLLGKDICLKRVRQFISVLQ